MIEYLEAIDIELFKVLNGFYCEFLDCLMWLISGKLTWALMYATLLFVAFRKGWREGLVLLVLTAVTVTLCDQISSSLIKPAVERLRPSRTEELAAIVHTVNGYHGGRYGFVSSHAANTFGSSVLVALILRRRALAWTVMLWAAVVSYSRIYLGVHFPGDVLCGAILGAVIGWGVYRLYLWCSGKAACKRFTAGCYTLGETRAVTVAIVANTLLLVAVAAVQCIVCDMA